MIALIFSGLSYWQSYDTGKLQRAQAKPLPTVIHAAFASIDKKHPYDDPHERVLIIVVTVTKMGVAIKEVAVKPEISFPLDEVAQKACYEDLNNQIFKDSLMGFEMNPGKPSIATVMVRFPKSCTGGGWNFVGEATFKGRDDAGHYYSQPALFNAQVPTDLP